ncbi:uncharacterized protein LOC142069259 isoform X1 [Caretta caretta]|uniref:uncharacterized protein LOC142069259 isoform X1 n=1 Tax=Caretta caretta TaxID=8467 RepID=UPI003F4BFA69
MRDRGYSRDATQCRVKLKELRQAYQKTKESNRRSGTEPQTCRFYAELHAILGGAATTTPPLSVDSNDGVLSSMPEDFSDGEDEEEEDELKESTQHTILPDSQDLFITLTEIPSQPNQAGEGTSAAANVSSLPPPSQRLSQIRRRKKCMRYEMFSELMQSSGTDRAQQNVWRDTVAEYRKVADEREERWWQEDQRRHEAMLGLLQYQTDILRPLVEVHERQQDHRLPLQPLFNCPPSSPSSIASSPRRPRTWGEGAGEAPGTQPLHPSGQPKQQKAVIQEVLKWPFPSLLPSSHTSPELPCELSPYFYNQLIKNTCFLNDNDFISLASKL